MVSSQRPLASRASGVSGSPFSARVTRSSDGKENGGIVFRSTRADPVGNNLTRMAFGTIWVRADSSSEMRLGSPDPRTWLSRIVELMLFSWL